jgi:hypothetical protein
LPFSPRLERASRSRHRRRKPISVSGTYSGSLTVHVTKTDKHSKADKGATKAYTVTNAKVKLHGENPASLTANSRVNLSGTVTTLAKKCDQTGFIATVTIKKADIKPPKPPKH